MYTTLKNIKNMSLPDLYNASAKAMLSQGNGRDFSQMLENRIEKLNNEIEKRLNK